MRTRDAAGQPPLVLDLGSHDDDRLAAGVRVLTRLAVAKALENLGLDSGPTMCSNVGNLHKAAPPGVSAPSEAKELVI
jgi:hypothetical protein